ncbi:carotenoid isomerase [Tanacetum coccineum]
MEALIISHDVAEALIADKSIKCASICSGVLSHSTISPLAGGLGLYKVILDNGFDDKAHVFKDGQDYPMYFVHKGDYSVALLALWDFGWMGCCTHWRLRVRTVLVLELYVIPRVGVRWAGRAGVMMSDGDIRVIVRFIGLGAAGAACSLKHGDGHFGPGRRLELGVRNTCFIGSSGMGSTIDPWSNPERIREILTKGNLNLITQALAAVGCKMDVIPDPTTVHFHLPNNLSVLVHREYNDFISELTSRFPHEKEGILKFYDVCWKIFNALNSLELKSLEEPIYLFGQFFKKPVECLTLAYYLPQNAGSIARNFIKDPEVLSFIDAECFIVSTVNALQTPMINAGMVLCDRHFGGINYPVGGVGGIAKSLAKGLVDQGSEILYKANVTSIIIDNGKAVGVKLSDGREFFAKTIISNATRWDTFGKLLKKQDLPKEEENFQKVYVKAPSFLSIHMGVKAEVLPPDTDCHHFVLEDDWKNLEAPYGSIFLSIPTILDSSLAPRGRHILHIFTTSSIEDWQGLSTKDYEVKKKLVADKIISRLEKKLFPGLKSSIEFIEVGTPKTHRRYLARDSGTYGPMPRNVPKGLLGMPFNTTAINGLYCVGDSCFPGQGVIAVAFSGVMCAHRVAADVGLEKKSPVLDAGLLGILGWLRSLA